MATLRESNRQSQQQKQLSNKNVTTQNTPKWGVESSVITAQKKSVSTINNSPLQKKANKTGLPDNVKSGIENLSGIGLNDVKVHYNSHKPAQMKANAFTQGNQIHIGPGQDKYIGHEAWHVVQQKQGRVKPTTQEGGLPVNDSPALEREADVMGGKAMQFKKENTRQLVSLRPPAKAPAQFNKNKKSTMASYLGGAVGSIAGALLGPSIPIIGPYLGHVGGGIIGGVLGFATGYNSSSKSKTTKKKGKAKTKLYPNLNINDYEDEYNKFSNFKKTNIKGKRLEERGTIIKYSEGTSDLFLKLLHNSKGVLYTVDYTGQLSIGSPVDDMKHAIVAENKKIKAAGWAFVDYNQKEKNKFNYDNYSDKIKKNLSHLNKIKGQVRNILFKYNTNIEDVSYKIFYKEITKSSEIDLIRKYQGILGNLENQKSELEQIPKNEMEYSMISKKNKIIINNSSGHYHPSSDTREIALQTWKNAGFTNLKWQTYINN